MLNRDHNRNHVHNHSNVHDHPRERKRQRLRQQIVGFGFGFVAWLCALTVLHSRAVRFDASPDPGPGQWRAFDEIDHSLFYYMRSGELQKAQTATARDVVYRYGNGSNGNSYGNGNGSNGEGSASKLVRIEIRPRKLYNNFTTSNNIIISMVMDDYFYIPPTDNDSNNNNKKPKEKRTNCCHPQPLWSYQESPKITKSHFYVSSGVYNTNNNDNTVSYAHQNYSILARKLAVNEVSAASASLYATGSTGTKRFNARPRIHKAAICKIRSTLINHLAHFAHAMEEMYKCFDYWVEHANLGLDNKSEGGNGGGGVVATNAMDNDNSNNNSNSDNNNIHGIVPVLLYDWETQGQHLLVDGFEKNAFMKGILEFLTAQFRLMVLPQHIYHNCHFLDNDNNIIINDNNNNNNNDSTASSASTNATAGRNTTTDADICQKLYHPDQTIRVHNTIGGFGGYLVRHAREWNGWMDRHLAQKKKQQQQQVEEQQPTVKLVGEQNRKLQKMRTRAMENTNENIDSGDNNKPAHKTLLKKGSQQTERREAEVSATENTKKKLKTNDNGKMDHRRRRLTTSASAAGDDNNDNKSNGNGNGTGNIAPTSASDNDVDNDIDICSRPPRISILNRRKTRTIKNGDKLARDLSEMTYVYGNGNGDSDGDTIREEKKRGAVKVVFFEGKTFDEQVHFFRNTDILISGHGAQLTGLVFMADNGKNNTTTASAPSTCKQVLEFFPKNYALPYYFGSLAVQSGMRHSFVYFDDGIKAVNATTSNGTVQPHTYRWRQRNPKQPLSPLRQLEPWEYVVAKEYKVRYRARKFKFCPRTDDMISYVVELVEDWYRCHGCNGESFRE